MPFTEGGLNAADVESKAMDRNVRSLERVQLVRNFYLDTGTRLSYLDDNNKETIFTPDQTAVQLFDATSKLKVAKANLKITAISLISLIAVSVVFFSIFLRFRFPQQS